MTKAVRNERGEKCCGFCKNWLPLDQFYLSKRNIPLSRCKACTKKNLLKWKQDNPEKYIESVRKSHRRPEYIAYRIEYFAAIRAKAATSK